MKTTKTIWTTTSALSTLLAGALLIGCGTTSDDVPPDRSGEPIAITPAPELTVPAGTVYPSFFENSTCVTVVLAGNKAKDFELEHLVSNFAEGFYGETFQAKDPDVVTKANQRRALFAGVPPGAELTNLANKEGADFTVLLHYDLDVEPYRDPSRRDISLKIIAKVTATIRGSAAKDGREVKVTLRHDQISNSDREDELRETHAAAVGKAVAKKLKLKISKAKMGQVKPKRFLIFKGFSASDKKDILDMVKNIKGIRARDVREKSAGEDEVISFELILSTRLAITVIRERFMDQAEEVYPNIQISQPGKSTLMFSNRR